MEIYDIVMLVVLIGAMLYGAVKGFAWQLASIASILGSYFVALKFREPFSQSISVDPPWNRFLAMLILYIGTSLLIWVGFRMVSGSIDRMKLREFDNHIGAIFGLIKGALYCTLITMFAVTLSGQQVREAVVRSKSGIYIAKVLDRSQSVIPPEIHEVIGPYIDRFEGEFRNAQSGDRTGDRTGDWAGDQTGPAGGLVDQVTPWLAGGAADASTSTPGQPWQPPTADQLRQATQMIDRSLQR